MATQIFDWMPSTVAEEARRKEQIRRKERAEYQRDRAGTHTFPFTYTVVILTTADHRISELSDTSGNPHHQSSSESRKRADSYQPRSTRRSTDNFWPGAEHSSQNDRLRRYSSNDYNGLSPQRSPSYPRGEVRQLSENFNAPTEEEVARDREHRKSLKGVEKWRTKFGGLFK